MFCFILFTLFSFMRQVLTMKLRLVLNSGSSCLNLPNVVITGVYHQTQLLSLVCQYIPQHALTNGNLLCPLKKRVAFILCIQIFSLMYVCASYLSWCWQRPGENIRSHGVRMTVVSHHECAEN